MRILVTAIVIALSVTAHADDRIGPFGELRRDVNGPLDPEVSDLYLSLSDLPLHDQRDQMWGLSSATKAALWTYNIQRYLRSHPELSSDAQNVLREGLRLVANPSWFDVRTTVEAHYSNSLALARLKARIDSVLARETIVEVFVRLGSEPFPQTTVLETPEPQSHASAIPRVESYGCTCAGNWECGYFSDSACDVAWCDPVPHCGVFANETCWGRCKRQL